jgi:hypothetical protein
MLCNAAFFFVYLRTLKMGGRCVSPKRRHTSIWLQPGLQELAVRLAWTPSSRRFPLATGEALMRKSRTQCVPLRAERPCGLAFLFFRPRPSQETTGFWTLTIVRNSTYNKTQRIGNGSVSVLRRGRATPTLLGLPQSPEHGNRSSFRYVVFSYI